MDVQLAETTTERLVLLTVIVWSRKKITMVFHQRVVYLLELLVAQILGEVDAENLCTDDRIEFAEFDRLVP